MAAEEFAALPAVKAPIEAAAFDEALLAAAVFHETNRVRRQLGLAELRPSAQADTAAGIQAAIIAIRNDLRHEHPLPTYTTAADRVRSTGLRAREVAENLARVSIYDTGGQEQMVIKRRGGREVFIDPRTGREAPLHSYASLAAEVVQRWMNSPGHRANIVNPRVDVLGCAVHAAKSSSGFDQVCAAQVFCAVGG